MNKDERKILIGFYALRELKSDRLDKALASLHYTPFLPLECGDAPGSGGRYADPQGLHIVFDFYNGHALVKGSPRVLQSESGVWYFALDDDWLLWK